MTDDKKYHHGDLRAALIDAAEAELAPRLAADGCTLLNVLSTFGPEGLEERKDSAGAYFLRY